MTLLNEYKDLILNVTYNSSIESNGNSQLILPEIENWEFRQITQFYFDLEVNFTLPLNVSQEIVKDTMAVEVYHNFIFKSLRTDNHVSLNFTTEPFEVPSQPLRKDKQLIEMLTLGVAASAVVSVVIPLVFMICLKFSMDKAWHFYLMLQVVSNIRNFDILVVPASAYPTILIISKISSFKITEEPLIRSYIKYLLDFHQNGFIHFIFYQGTFFTVLLWMAFLLILLLLMRVVKMKQNIVDWLKNKIMWSPIMRSQIQFYLMTGVSVFRYFKSDEKNPFNTFTKSLQFILLVIFPFYAHIKIHGHRNQLILDKYRILYGPLFRNLYFHSMSVFFWIPLFCAARFSLAIATGLFEYTVVPCVYCLFGWTIVQMQFHNMFNPMRDKILNYQERFYLLVIYFYTYFMFFFTPWIDDNHFRYELGWQYMFIFICVCIISFILIGIDLYFQLSKLRRMKKYQNKIKQQQLMHQNQIMDKLKLKILNSFKKYNARK